MFDIITIHRSDIDDASASPLGLAVARKIHELQIEYSSSIFHLTVSKSPVQDGTVAVVTATYGLGTKNAVVQTHVIVLDEEVRALYDKKSTRISKSS